MSTSEIEGSDLVGADALAVLAVELRAESAVVADHVREPDALATLGALVAAGPAVAGVGAAYAVIFEAVREGYLLHFGSPRIVRAPDRDLALLAGDFLYAKGLERLAAFGDLGAVGELSDLIALSAQLHARDETATIKADVGALWLASAVAIAVGPGTAHERAKRKLREGGSARELYAVAARSAANAGLDEQLSAGAETVGFSPPDRG